MKLGALLAESKVISREQLKDALQTAERTGLPVGRILIMSGYLTDATLQASVQIQSLLKENQIDRDMAVVALGKVKETGGTALEALTECGVELNENVKTNKIGELLLSGGFITPEELEAALMSSVAAGLPLGRVLTLQGTFSEQFIAAVLSAQMMIRDGKMTEKRAISGLRAAHLRLEMPLMQRGELRLPSRSAPRLGEMFVLAGILSDNELLNALEMGLSNNCPVGQMLIQLGYIESNDLDVALELQRLVGSNKIGPLQAVGILKEVHFNHISLEEALARAGSEKPREYFSLGKFLKLIGMITDRDIAHAIKIGVENSQILGSMLIVSGILDEFTITCAMRLGVLMEQGALSVEQACYVFSCSQQRRMQVEDVLEELGWDLKRHSSAASEPAPLDARRHRN